MLLAINDYKTIGDLQDHFNKCFPCLKIEFYYDPPGKKKAHLQAVPVPAGIKIGEFSKKHENGILEIKSWDKIEKMEKNLQHLFGLNAKIFRLQNGNWVQPVPGELLVLKEREKSDSFLGDGKTNITPEEEEPNFFLPGDPPDSSPLVKNN